MTKSKGGFPLVLLSSGTGKDIRTGLTGMGTRMEMNNVDGNGKSKGYHLEFVNDAILLVKMFCSCPESNGKKLNWF